MNGHLYDGAHNSAVGVVLQTLDDGFLQWLPLQGKEHVAKASDPAFDRLTLEGHHMVLSSAYTPVVT